MADILILQEDNGKTFNVRPGDTIEIRLIDNPTTGYRWTPSEFDERVINLQETNFETAAEAGVGAGGVRTFTFLAESPGTVKIQFLLGREWEPKDAAKDHYEVTIHVQE